jgi:alpha-glucosidase
VTSPDGHVAIRIGTGAGGKLQYTILRDTTTVVAPSDAGIVVDGTTLTDGIEFGVITAPTETSAEYAVRGVHAVAHDRSRNWQVHLGPRASRVQITLQVRVFNDGVGFRFVVPGTGTRTPDEATTFVLPTSSTTWSHDLHGHYEAQYVKRVIEDVPAGDWAAPPLTYKLPGDGGYASITEAALTGYAGMALQADGHGAYAARLGHAQPVSYPYALRYSAEDVQRLAKPAAIDGEIRTPWRVVIVSKDLNGLVNNDIIHNLNPPPDQALFPQGLDTPWIKPGRAVWRYLDGGDNTYDGLKHFTDLAAAIGYEYHVVEGVWRQWTAEQLKAFVDYANERHVGILLWQHSRDLRTAEQRQAFFELCRRNGVAGAKIDFFDHEAKEVIDLYEALLREAAQYHLVLDFHGANKPTGLDRTWPNELTREAVQGLEHRAAIRGPHDATLPFTRFLAGGADYTPTVFGDRRGETSIAHQIATAVVFTSPLLVFGGQPQSFLDSPAVEILKNIPSTWDETIVLPPSEIGEVAVYARRKGQAWFVAAVNGRGTRSVTVNPAFLAKSRSYQATIARDDLSNAAAVKVETVTLSSGTPITFELRDGGGFVARLAPSGS